ncbi:dehydrogenase [Apiospora sp. TS-2023a]
MRALRYHGPGDLRVEHDIPEPECLPHQVKVRPAWCGICGSDLHAYLSDKVIPLRDVPHPLTGETWPIVFGHEFSGDIVAVGSDVAKDPNGPKVGDRVACQPTICCNHCHSCKEGAVNCCDDLGFIGLMGGGGGCRTSFALMRSLLISSRARSLTKLEVSEYTFLGGSGNSGRSLVEPLSVAWHAVEIAAIKPGDDVLVMGAGPIGLAVIQCLKAQDFGGQIIVVELSSKRKEFARQCGATTVLDPQEDDVVAKCRSLTGGQGPAVALECAGVAASMNAACRAVRTKGLIVNVALWEEPVPIDMMALLFGEKRLATAISLTASDFKAVIDALESGRLQVEGMITHRIKMDEVVHKGFEALMTEKDTTIKVLVDCRI